MSHGKHISVLVLLCLIMVSPPLIGQDEGGEEGPVDEYSGEGFTLQGASGFFNVHSPVLIRPGNILAGFSYRSEFGEQGLSAPPATIGYGLAQFSEVYVAFEPRNYVEGNEENEMLLGVKMLGLALGRATFGAGVEYRSVDVTASGVYDGRYAHYGAKLLVGYEPGLGIRLLANAGYALLEQDSDHSSDHAAFGAGLSIPFNTSLLMIADAAGRLYSTGSSEFTSTLGARYYIFEHIQINAGLQINQHNDKLHTGVLMGIGFSSEILRTGQEGDDGGEYFPELPSLDALEKNEPQEIPGVVPEMPSLDDMDRETKEEATDDQSMNETVPDLPSLDELEAREKEPSEPDSDPDNREESTPPRENTSGIPPVNGRFLPHLGHITHFSHKRT